jgi:hypothetical protein
MQISMRTNSVILVTDEGDSKGHEPSLLSELWCNAARAAISALNCRAHSLSGATILCRLISNLCPLPARQSLGEGGTSGI